MVCNAVHRAVSRGLNRKNSVAPCIVRNTRNDNTEECVTLSGNVGIAIILASMQNTRRREKSFFIVGVPF